MHPCPPDSTQTAAGFQRISSKEASTAGSSRNHPEAFDDVNTIDRCHSSPGVGQLANRAAAQQDTLTMIPGRILQTPLHYVSWKTMRHRSLPRYPTGLTVITTRAGNQCDDHL
jgi:hypothetical protein